MTFLKSAQYKIIGHFDLKVSYTFGETSKSIDELITTLLDIAYKYFVLYFIKK